MAQIIRFLTLVKIFMLAFILLIFSIIIILEFNNNIRTHIKTNDSQIELTKDISTNIITPQHVVILCIERQVKYMLHLFLL